jgi:type VI secretion system protein ImpC
MSDNPRHTEIRLVNTMSPDQPTIPLRIIAIADLRSAESVSTDADTKALRVDKDTFKDVLHKICPRIGFHVQDRNTSTGSYSRIEFAVEDLRSFHPASVVREVGSLRNLLIGRQALADLRDSKITREQFLQQLKALPDSFVSSELLSKALQQSPRAGAGEATAPAQPISVLTVQDESHLDAILDMVEAPGKMPSGSPQITQGAARVRQLISEMLAGEGKQPATDRAALNAAIVECDRALTDQMNDVLCHQEFRRLESSWRSLKFLVDHTDFREPVQLEILCARKEQLIEVLRLLLEESEIAEVPPAALITDFEFENSPPDMELLKQAAELAQQLQAPLLVNVGAAFFSKGNALETAGIPLLRSHLESAEFVKWTSFRQSEASRWVGVCFNRFLLRSLYDESSAGKMPFRFTDQQNPLWANPSWAIGSLLTGCFARTGWCGHITGMRAGGVIEDLQVHNCGLLSGGETQIPLETIFLKDREDDFFGAGFMVLQSGKDQDKAILLRAPSAHQPEKYSDARETETSHWRSELTHQLVAAQLGRYVELMIQKLLPSGNPAEIGEGIKRGLDSLLTRGCAEKTARVLVRLSSSEEQPGLCDLQIQIKPGPAIWSLPIALELRMSLNLGV